MVVATSIVHAFNLSWFKSIADFFLDALVTSLE